MSDDYKGWYHYIDIRQGRWDKDVEITWHDVRDTIKWLNVKTIGM